MTSTTCVGIHNDPNGGTPELHGVIKRVEAKEPGSMINLPSKKNNHAHGISRSFHIQRRFPSTTRGEIQGGVGHVVFRGAFLETMCHSTIGAKE
ncbi:unnamed protein product [Linum trigynum]|uniref:Uncharacterized protein n=1 Tax=Linum trigynum TaxID=586398 RepID=A0AAV2DF54_9ROSI